MTLPWLSLCALLLAGAVGLRGAGLAGPRDPPWRARLDLVLALVLGAGLATWWFSWLGRWALFPWPVLARDFAQVCDAVRAAAEGQPPSFPQRSPVAAALPGLLRSHLGIVDALLVSSTLSTAALLAALALWARAAQGRLAAVAACLLAGALPALATLPRQLSLYPELIAAFVASAAAAMAALRWRGPATLLLCGSGAGLALLVDPRGLPHALAALACGLLALRRPRDLAWLLAPLPLSWLLAHQAWPAATPGLETQLHWYAADGAPPPPLHLDHPAFLWGHSPLSALPATLAWLVRQPSAGAPPGPLLALLAVCLPLALWPLRRDPRRLVGLLLLLAPFLAVALTAAHVRHEAWGGAALPLLAGLALGAPASSAAGSGREAPGLALAGAVLALLVAGVLPSPLAPQAPGRTPVPETPDIDALRAVHPDAPPDRDLPFDDPACVQALREDLVAGHPWGGRWTGPWPEWELAAP